MHDPLVVAFHIRLPIPRKTNPTFKRLPNGKSWYVSKRGYLQIGQRAWRCPTLVTVWHHEPGGRDSGMVCKRGRRGWHVHHWRVQVPALQEVRRKLLTRCEWCGGKHTKNNKVDVSHSWGGQRGRWWRGEPGLFHSDCSAVYGAKLVCLCEDPLTVDGSMYAGCLLCGKRRYGPMTPESLAIHRLYATVNDGEKPSGEMRDRIKVLAAQGRERC